MPTLKDSALHCFVVVSAGLALLDGAFWSAHYLIYLAGWSPFPDISQVFIHAHQGLIHLIIPQTILFAALLRADLRRDVSALPWACLAMVSVIPFLFDDLQNVYFVDFSSPVLLAIFALHLLTVPILYARGLYRCRSGGISTLAGRLLTSFSVR